MRKLVYLSISMILIMSLFVAGPSSSVFASRLNATSPTLGAVASYSVLGHTTVTNTGNTTMPGDLGISIGGAPTGFPPGLVGPPGTIRNAADSLDAQADNTAAYGYLAQDCTTTYAGNQDLSLVSPLVAGVYCADAFSLSGNLTLEGSGVWIFKSTSTLITSSESSITGGDPCNVWWRVESSATLGTYSSFIGNILAYQDIALNTGATINGRALTQVGQVTLQSNVFSAPPCYQALPTATPTSTATVTATASATATGTITPAAPTATNLPVVTALPPTGGAPLQNDGSSWGLLIAGSFSALVLILGVRAYRKTSKPRL